HLNDARQAHEHAREACRRERAKMERSLLWSAFALGWAGWLCAMVTPKRRPEEAPPPRPIARAAWSIAWALPAIVFFATLPGRPPRRDSDGCGRHAARSTQHESTSTPPPRRYWIRHHSDRGGRAGSLPRTDYVRSRPLDCD